MSTNEHLLDNFSASKETKSLGRHILRLAHIKTGPGSGRELHNYRVGLPAACMLIACEQLNTTEVTKKSAQAAACLAPKEFQKVYDTVKAVLDEQENASHCSYASLHNDHQPGFKLNDLQPFIMEVENEIIPRGYEADSNLTKCGVYFWVLNCVKPKALLSTTRFAQEYELPLRKFTSLLEIMNEHCKPIRKQIQSQLKTSAQSPVKPSTASAATPSHLSARDLPDRSPNKGGSGVDDTLLRRRSERTASSPAKKAAAPPWKKGPSRVLPTNDSPRRLPQDAPKADISNTPMDPNPETPSKRRRLESPSKSNSRDAFITALATPGSSHVLKELTPRKQPIQSARLFPASPTKRKQAHTAEANLPEGLTSSDESEAEPPRPRRRFRPVYGEQEQWASIDPRVAKLWGQPTASLSSSTDGTVKALKSPRKSRTRSSVTT